MCDIKRYFLNLEFFRNNPLINFTRCKDEDNYVILLKFYQNPPEPETKIKKQIEKTKEIFLHFRAFDSLKKYKNIY